MTRSEPVCPLEQVRQAACAIEQVNDGQEPAARIPLCRAREPDGLELDRPDGTGPANGPREAQLGSLRGKGVREQDEAGGAKLGAASAQEKPVGRAHDGPAETNADLR